jgi:predicted acetyltransferase
LTERLAFRPIEANDAGKLVDVLAEAYPGLHLSSADERRSFAKRIKELQAQKQNTEYFALYDDDQQLLGGLCIYSYRMNFRNEIIPVTGVGLVAVDFLRKKQRIGKALLENYLGHTLRSGASLAVLYAFRTDFYYQMGFGFGPKMHQYRIQPARFPKQSFAGIRRLTAADTEEVHAFYQRRVSATHGLMETTLDQWERFLKSDHAVIGFEENGEVQGYLAYHFQSGQNENFGTNDLVIDEWLYATPIALQAFMGFLHSQADQIRHVIVNTSDEDFYHLIPDARNDTHHLIPHVYHETNTSGVGLMYRVVSVRNLFTEAPDVNFGGQTCRVRFNVLDSFFPQNDGATIVWFEHGRACVQTRDAVYDVEVSLDVATFSSLVMGVIPFHRLIQYGQADISDKSYAKQVNALFATTDKPLCTTGF